MKARLICLLLAIASLTTASAGAQHRRKIPRIGHLSVGSATSPLGEAERGFRRGLRDLAYIAGQNLTVEQRYAEGRTERLSELAAELVRSQVDAIATLGTPTAIAAKRATTAIPIVFYASSDPLGAGIVTSLARPGGNVTGQSNMAVDLYQKQIEILKEAVPKLSRLAVLWHGDDPAASRGVKLMEEAGKAFGVQLRSLPLQAISAEALEAALKKTEHESAEAIITLPSPVTRHHRARINGFGLSRRIPIMWSFKEYADAGATITYGPSNFDVGRRAAAYVDRILKGARPADLPVEQPTKFELVINLKAAKQIGLTIPPNVLARADRVIR